MADIPVSIDLETLGTRPDAVILSIAAAARVDGILVVFTSPVAISEESQGNRFIDSATLAWWKAPERKELFARTMEVCENAPPLASVLKKLSAWYAALGGDQDRLYPWGNGASFDIAILDHAFATSDVAAPWAYWTTRDLRTLKHLAQDLGVFKKVERSEGTHHDATSDAINQLCMIETWWAAIKGVKEAA